jgi:cytochrome c
MKNKMIQCAGLALVLMAGQVMAAEFASKAEAEAMVKKAVAALKSGKDATLAEITSKSPKWVDRDLYAVVYDMKGSVRAHGQNDKMVGKDVLELKDPDGKLYVKERVELAGSKGKFWQEYKFTDPVTKKALPKEAYCEKLDEMIVCAGVYKR